MKTLLILFPILLCSFAAYETCTVHQPDFTQAHYYSPDSIYVVQEFNTGSAHEYATGETWCDVCDFMACTDSIATYWKIHGKKGVVTSYVRRTTGYWVMYVDGKKSGKAAIETNTLVHTEDVPNVDDAGHEYMLRIEYYKTNVIDDIKRKIAQDDKQYPRKITKADAQ